MACPVTRSAFLRDRVRAEVRRRGWRFQSATRDGCVVAMCPDALSPERRALVERDALVRMRAIADGTKPMEPSWRFQW